MPMLTLGIDVALARTGWALLDGEALAAHGVIATPASLPLPSRLCRLSSGVRDILVAHPGISVAVAEAPYMGGNRRTSMTLAHASGAVLARLARPGLAVHSVTATRARKLCGYPQTKPTEAIRAQYGEELSEDVCDAIILALAASFLP